jgi:hypothetical protein
MVGALQVTLEGRSRSGQGSGPRRGMSRVDRHVFPPESQRKPLLLVDVDGVVSLFGFPPCQRPFGSFVLVDGTAHFLSADAGRHLLDLGRSYDLVWCTGWEEKANEYLPAALGLPGPLPYLSFEHTPAGGRPHWKLPAIDAYAGHDRPVAWIDDAHDDESRAWAQDRTGPTLLVDTDPAVGITTAHVRRLSRWAEEVAG